MNPLQELHEAGVAIWLDTMRRDLVTSGQFARLVQEDALTGVTSNPSIFEKAISGSTDYDAAIAQLMHRGVEDPMDLFFDLGLEDIAAAADLLRPAFEGSDGQDGFASFEVRPVLANHTLGTVDEARGLWTRLDRPNVMIKVPGTEAGIPAIERLTAEGVNVNVTLLFSIERYEAAALAYIAGLEHRLELGQPIGNVASVASFFVSRIDTAVDRKLSDGSPLRGRVALANAVLAYRLFRELFSGSRWERLAGEGARLQRPLWASTGTKNPEYSDVLYVEELIAPDTVNTMPEATMRAFKHHGRVRPSIQEQMDQAEGVLEAAAAAGIDLAQVTGQLLEEGIEAFSESYQKLLGEIESKVDAVRRQDRRLASHLPGLDQRLTDRLVAFDDQDLLGRIWAKDFTVWRRQPAEISDRLGWLTVQDLMDERVPELRDFAEGAANDGLTDVLLMGMGGSSLAPEVLRSTFGGGKGLLDLVVLDSTHPDQILAVERSLDLDRTLFVVASKSGTTTETLSHFAYFWEKVPDGSRFVAITDPGTPLEQLAAERKFRWTFRNPPDIGGRYSALSYFGLVPAALVGVDLEALVDRAAAMAVACAACVPAVDNPGARLGATIGEAALAGRDKLTLVLSDDIRTLGYWIEQLVAESTGKENKGVVPIEGEDLGPPGVYGGDRLFVGVGDTRVGEQLRPLEEAGHPSVHLSLESRADLGAEFLRWEFATAVAGHVLGIHPFDQPNVQEAKDATRRLLSQGEVPDPGYDPVRSLVDQVATGDYIAIQAYLPRTEENEARLHAARMWLRDHLKVATTVGFGPRFLHSTGQLHKGGPPTGVFMQVAEPPKEDLAIPGQSYTFGRLLAAQAVGDLQALRSRGRRVARVHLNDLEALAR